VWRSSSSFGCGAASKPVLIPSINRVGGCKVVVCRYLSPGNVVGDASFRANVLPRV
jgi:hypothetical protein